MPRKPKPFRRPSIDLDGKGRKEWQDVPAESLKVGDIVQDYGQVKDVASNNHGTTLSFLSGTHVFYDPKALVRAFTAVK